MKRKSFIITLYKLQIRSHNCEILRKQFKLDFIIC